MKFAYVVIKCGIYRHELPGVYTSYTAAKKRACDVIKLEPDDYHSFDVYKFTVNVPTDDGNLVCSVSRHGGEVKVEEYT